MFDIDVYAKPFDQHKNYTFYENDRGNKLLLMKHDLDDAIKEKVLAEFTGIEKFQLRNRNIGSQKWYADVYEKFKREVKFPAWYIDKMCNAESFHHFYSKSFVAATRDRWLE